MGKGTLDAGVNSLIDYVRDNIGIPGKLVLNAEECPFSRTQSKSYIL
jgi:hypothetical protein